MYGTAWFQSQVLALLFQQDGNIYWYRRVLPWNYNLEPKKFNPCFIAESSSLSAQTKRMPLRYINEFPEGTCSSRRRIFAIRKGETKT
jgi:hypothetical protein